MGKIKGFEIIKSGLFRCKKCGMTFDTENECIYHLEEMKELLKRIYCED